MKKRKIGKRSHRSSGELISTFTFGAVGLFFAGEAQVLWYEGAFVQSGVILVCCIFCLAGAFRFQLHNFWNTIQSFKK